MYTDLLHTHQKYDQVLAGHLKYTDIMSGTCHSKCEGMATLQYYTYSHYLHVCILQ